ncbi:hypothetical protein L7F22_035145 [Adiantum nelumboides]|nr:hypothetical protein [Adiantum nelumboides]
MDNDQRQGSFKLLRSFLGTIAGGLSSLASLPFGKRKRLEDSPLPDASPSSRAGLGESKDDLSRLFPDMELSESRKRARLSLEEVFEEYNSSKEVEGPDGKGLEESSEINLCETSVGVERATNQLDYDQKAADKMLDDFDVTAFMSGVSHDSQEIEIQHNPNVSIEIEALSDVEEDPDDFLASFRTTLVAARKTKEQKRAQSPLKEESPRKKVRFGESSSGDKRHSESPQGQISDTLAKKGSERAKRKRVDVAKDKNEKKLRALLLSEELARPEGRTSTVGMSSILTRKRERVDDDNSQKTSTEGVKLQKEKRVKRSNSIGEADKSTNCQSARIVFKDEHSAKAAVAHNNMEFNGNRLHVTAAHAGVAKEVCVPMDESWSIFVSNTPTDVKDEELFDLFSGSLKVDVTAVRVIRQPQTGLSKGTAYVYFKTQADVSRLLSSRHTLTLRGRVLRISRALASIQAEQKSKQPQSTKHSSNPGMDDNSSRKKRVKLASFDGSKTPANEPSQGGEQMLTRSRRGDNESGKQQIDVRATSSPAYTTRRTASLGPHENLEESPDAKRKRNEKRQRGISRSKKIRRTNAGNLLPIVFSGQQSYGLCRCWCILLGTLGCPKPDTFPVMTLFSSYLYKSFSWPLSNGVVKEVALPDDVGRL